MCLVGPRMALFGGCKTGLRCCSGCARSTKMKLEFDVGVTMHAVVAPPAVAVGKIKSFGPFGPKYEVGHALRQFDDGD